MIYTSECAVNFTIRIARLVLTHHADSVELKSAVQKRESEWIHKQLQRLVWTKEEGGIQIVSWLADAQDGMLIARRDVIILFIRHSKRITGFGR